jgi:magnesium-transporting ATPase (P-type)
MSVLAKDNKTGKVYIFAKGSPELMHHHSLRKIKDYDRLIKNLSLSGFRLITYGFCEIPPAQI